MAKYNVEYEEKGTWGKTSVEANNEAEAIIAAKAMLDQDSRIISATMDNADAFVRNLREDLNKL